MPNQITNGYHNRRYRSIGDGTGRLYDTHTGCIVHYTDILNPRGFNVREEMYREEQRVINTETLRNIAMSTGSGADRIRPGSFNRSSPTPVKKKDKMSNNFDEREHPSDETYITSPVVARELAYPTGRGTYHHYLLGQGRVEEANESVPPAPFDMGDLMIHVGVAMILLAAIGTVITSVVWVMSKL